MEQRYIFTLLAFIGNMVNLFGRDSLRIGVLAIRAEFEACLVNSTLNATEEDCGPVVWDDSSVAQLLGSFNYGMVLTMVLGGPLADMAGGKIVMLATTLISSLCTLAVPFLAATSLPLLLTVQVIYGMSGGLVVPALSSMLARWEPVRERGRLATIIYSGSQASAVLAAVLTGLATYTLGWRHAFILLGGLPLLWLLPWILLVSDSPGQQRGISREELHLLLAETATSAARPSLRDIPVRAILSSGPVWAAADVPPPHRRRRRPPRPRLPCLRPSRLPLLHRRHQNQHFIDCGSKTLLLALPLGFCPPLHPPSHRPTLPRLRHHPLHLLLLPNGLQLGRGLGQPSRHCSQLRGDSDGPGGPGLLPGDRPGAAHPHTRHPPPPRRPGVARPLLAGRRRHRTRQLHIPCSWQRGPPAVELEGGGEERQPGGGGGGGPTDWEAVKRKPTC